jgi:hypothetical protein
MAPAIKLGFCGASIRMLLLIMNAIFFLLGLMVFVTAAVLKWGSSLTDYLKIDGIQELVGLTSINSVTTFLLILGAFIIVVSVSGFIGAKFNNRFFLITYTVILVLLFLAHGIGLIVLLVDSSTFEDEFKKDFNSTIKNLVNSSVPVDKYNETCSLLLSVSKVFKCCGADNVEDLPSIQREKCCTNYATAKYKNGCTPVIIDDIKSNAFNLIVIPSLVVLVVELFGIILVPFLIGRIRK